MTKNDYNQSIQIRSNVESVLIDHPYFGNNSEMVGDFFVHENDLTVIDSTTTVEDKIEIKSVDHSAHIQALENIELKNFIKRQ